MAFTGRRVSVDTTSGGTVIATGADPGSDAPTDLPGLVIKNADASASVALGGSGVTYAAGFLLAAGATLPIGALGAGDILYGISTSGTVVVHVLEVS
jgi:hypothetical protein